MRIDDHILAGYLAGELSQEERTAVTRELILDSRLREWLHLATQALAAADEENSKGPQLRLIETMQPESPKRMNGDRQSMPSITLVRKAM